MKIRFLSVFLVTFAVSAAQQLVTPDRTAIFPSAAAENLIRTVCYHSPTGVTGYWLPEEKDLAGVEDMLVDYLRANKVRDKEDWSEYRRQVVGVTRSDDRLLFISYFHFSRSLKEARERRGIDPDLWKKQPFRMFDGGTAFFRVLYDLKEKRFVWLETNG